MVGEVDGEGEMGWGRGGRWRRVEGWEGYRKEGEGCIRGVMGGGGEMEEGGE